MTWKHEIQLRDLDPSQSIEALCRRCGNAHYEQAAALQTTPPLTPFSYLDEVERHLTCHRWACPGPITLTLADNTETSAFVGGLS